MRIKVIYQINEKYALRKIEINFYKKNITFIHFKDLPGSYVELENKLIVTEEKFKINDSEVK